MSSLVEEVIESHNLNKYEIKSRLEQFKKIGGGDRFKEFIFCLLTPQSNARKCWDAVEKIFRLDRFEDKKIRDILKTRTRFHNNKTAYVIKAEESWKDIEPLLDNKNTLEKRNIIADKVKGYGLKEASHFLRNIGLSNNKIAILDRHILRNLKKLGIIKEEKIKSEKDYLDIERKFAEFSNRVKIPMDELDLLFWSSESGGIFK